MRTYHAGFAVVVALVAGLAVGYLAGSQSQGPAPVVPQLAEVPEPQRPERPRPQPEPEPVAEAPAETQPTPDGDDRWAEILPPDTNESFRAWIEQLDVQPPRGNGRIWRIVTADGDPVPGVTVTARLEAERTERVPDNLELQVRSSAEYFVRRRLGVLRAVTDDSGRYEFANLPYTGVFLTAHGAGYDFSDWRPPGSELRSAPGPASVQPDAVIHIQGTRVTGLLLDIRLPNGEQPDSATVIFPQEPTERARGARRAGRSWTPDRPTVNVPPGRIVLDFQVWQHYSHYVTDPIEVEIVEGEGKKVFVQMRYSPTIRLTVDHPLARVSRQAGVSAGRVEISPLRARLQRDPPAEVPERLDNSMSTHLNWRDGTLEISRLQAGRYRLYLTIAGQILAHKDVELGYEVLEIEMTPREPDPAGFLVVQVRSPQGDPLAVHVTIRPTFARDSLRGTAMGLGEYWFRPATPPDDAGDWHYLVFVKCEYYGEHYIEHARHDLGPLEVQFQDRSTLHLNVRRPANQPGKTLHYVLIAEQPDGVTDNQRRVANGIVDESGRLEFDGLAPGSYYLLVYSSTMPNVRGSNNLPLLRQAIDLRSGLNEVRIDVPPLYNVYLLRRPDAGYSVTFQSVHGGRRDYRFSEEDDRRIPVGQYAAGLWLLTWNGSRNSMLVDIQGDTDVALEHTNSNALAVVIHRHAPDDVRQLAERKGLRAGDMIVAVNGDDPQTPYQMEQALKAMQESDVARLTIVRGGARLQIAISGESLKQLQEARGMFELLRVPRP